MKSYEKIIYSCQECGYESGKWFGRCPSCGKFNTFVEEISYTSSHKISSFDVPSLLKDVELKKEERIIIPLKEFNRVLGGGIVYGSLVLMGGEPGIGKSTILLQISNLIGENYGKILYVSGEESKKQTKLRAERITATSSNLYILSETNLKIIETHAISLKPVLLILDSIQTTYLEEIPSSPGSVSQVRECTYRLLTLAKKENIATFIIGHVTKDGTIAGPKVLEHIVDTVLYLEGEKYSNLRLLRAVKNRFGPTDELGVFKMEEKGLKEIENPSEVFLENRATNTSGSVIISHMEGTRPILLELQALVSSSFYAIPRRLFYGLDYNRISLILAVLEKRLGLNLASKDVYLNLAGGIKSNEPCSDLGAALAVISSFKNIPIFEEMVVLGELGLGGEVRTVNFVEKRIKEAKKLGFKKFIVPYSNLKDLDKDKDKDIDIICVKRIDEAERHCLKK